MSTSAPAGPAPVVGPSGVNVLDVVLVLTAVAVAMAGARRGLLVSLASAAGLLGGVLVAVRFVPDLAARLVQDTGWGPGGVVGQRFFAAVLIVLLAAAAQAVAVGTAARLRERVHRLRAGPLDAGRIDAAGGAAFEVVAVLLVAWLLASAAAVAPAASWREQVRGSAVLRGVDAVAPAALRRWSDSLDRLVQRHAMPFFVAPFGAAPVPPAALALPPDAEQARRVGGAAATRVVRVVGVAPACDRLSEGSGFVYAPRRVMTNAHVVAGTRSTSVDVPGQGRLPARVVLFDPGRDIAVLAVPQLRTMPLRFAAVARSGADAVVIGYPGGGPLTLIPARIAGRQRVSGPDIYHHRRVTREVYTLRARVRPGNSGGPVLTDGRVAGMIFAANADRPDVGYALTAAQIASAASTGRTATAAVSTRGCT